MRGVRVAAVVLCGLALVSEVQAQSGGVSGAASVGAARQDASAQVRRQVSENLQRKWSNYIQEVYRTSPDQWMASMAPLFEQASVDTLVRAADARTFDAMNDILTRGDAPVTSPVALGNVEARLGDPGGDLVFVPIAPCRVFDTRVVGGPIGNGAARDFDITDVANYSVQGGASGNCSGLGAAGSFAAVAINLTVVSPAGAGFITVYPWNTSRPLAATVLYAAGAVVGNLSIVRLDQTAAANEMTIYSFASTDVVADVVGYFIAPQPTALECVQTFASTSRTAGQTFNMQIPACPSGYTLTGAGCRTPGYNDASWAINGLFGSASLIDAFCSGLTNTATTIEGTGQCCRVPGR